MCYVGFVWLNVNKPSWFCKQLGLFATQLANPINLAFLHFSEEKPNFKAFSITGNPRTRKKHHNLQLATMKYSRLFFRFITATTIVSNVSSLHRVSWKRLTTVGHRRADAERSRNSLIFMWSALNQMCDLPHTFCHNAVMRTNTWHKTQDLISFK